MYLSRILLSSVCIATALITAANASTKKYDCGEHSETISGDYGSCQYSATLNVTVGCESSVWTNVEVVSVTGGNIVSNCSGAHCNLTICCGGNTDCCTSKDDSQYCCEQKYGLEWRDNACCPDENSAKCCLSPKTWRNNTCCADENSEACCPSPKVWRSNTCCADEKSEPCCTGTWTSNVCCSGNGDGQTKSGDMNEVCCDDNHTDTETCCKHNSGTWTESVIGWNIGMGSNIEYVCCKDKKGNTVSGEKSMACCDDIESEDCCSISGGRWDRNNSVCCGNEAGKTLTGNDEPKCCATDDYGSETCCEQNGGIWNAVYSICCSPYAVNFGQYVLPGGPRKWCGFTLL